MKQVFISFSTKQQEQADAICRLIEANGVSCFISHRDLLPGQEYANQLLTRIDEASVVLLLLSKDSNESPHVLREIEYAVSHRTPILVYRLEEVTLSKSMEYFLMTHQWINETPDKNTVLIKSIKNLIHNKKKNSKYSDDTDENIKEIRGIKNISLISMMILIVFLLLVIAMFLFAYIRKMDTNDEVVEYNLGDTVTFGTYYDEPIDWRVIKINDDDSIYLISTNILTIKAYDAAEGGEYNVYKDVNYWSFDNHIIEDKELQVLVRGNNNWSESNIRTWLNSDKEVVTYEDQAPTINAVPNNAYSNEPGFLHSFTESEKEALIEVITSTNGVNTKDYVFLLSTTEMQWLKDAGMSIYAMPTNACNEHNDDYEYYKSLTETYKTDSYYWWLRDNPGDKANEVYMVVTEYEENIQFSTQSVGVSGCGVRPVICVDTTKL